MVGEKGSKDKIGIFVVHSTDQSLVKYKRYDKNETSEKKKRNPKKIQR